MAELASWCAPSTRVLRLHPRPPAASWVWQEESAQLGAPQSIATTVILARSSQQCYWWDLSSWTAYTMVTVLLYCSPSEPPWSARVHQNTYSVPLFDCIMCAERYGHYYLVSSSQMVLSDHIYIADSFTSARDIHSTLFYFLLTFWFTGADCGKFVLL